MVTKIVLTEFGESIKAGLSPRTKALIGKEIKSSRDFEKLMLEVGTSNYAILTYKEVK